jgi:hypothetical protein
MCDPWILFSRMRRTTNLCPNNRAFRSSSVNCSRTSQYCHVISVTRDWQLDLLVTYTRGLPMADVPLPLRPWILSGLRYRLLTYPNSNSQLTQPQLKVSQSHVTTDGQSVSMPWCRVHSGTCDQILLSVGRPLWLEVGPVSCQSIVKVKAKVILRPTVSWPVRLGVRCHLGPATNFSFSLKFYLDSCGFVIL